MYGQIHMCVRSLVLEKFGEEAWNRILAKTGCTDREHFMVFHSYDDCITLSLIKTVSEVLDVPMNTVLEVFGEYFLKYCMEHGYDKMLRTLGNNFYSFIQNLDSLHALLAMSYKNINAPSFRCENNPDGSLILHYYSTRKGFDPIVTGLLRAVGRELFNTVVTSEVLSIQEETLTEGRIQHHTTFKVVLETKESVEESKSEAGSIAYLDCKDLLTGIETTETHLISPRSFASIFPFHILFDKELRIQQCGANIHRVSHTETKCVVKLHELFSLVAPRMPLTFDYILRFINASYILQMNDIRNTGAANEITRSVSTDAEPESQLLLKGQMIYLSEIDHIIFIGSPRLTSLTEMQERNLYLSDIPIYDVTRELVLLNQQRIAEIEISKKLDETTAELKRTAQALEEEKKKTDILLYQMLPVKVANQLRDGIKVEAEKFKEATILFSDIVTFTNIAAAVQPMDIVDMLNALYSRFDELTSVHGVYKVETIGDAYMVVGGVPEESTKHAQAVARMALGMQAKSQEVMSPASNKPLEIRVGMHTGSVVAGVVGDKMPRYCLFGDTVNTASRMESHGLPGRIHCSPSSYSALENTKFIFEPRGEIDVKGKGLMVTHFLIGCEEDDVTSIDSAQNTSNNNGGRDAVNHVERDEKGNGFVEQNGQNGITDTEKYQWNTSCSRDGDGGLVKNGKSCLIHDNQQPAPKTAVCRIL